CWCRIAYFRAGCQRASALPPRPLPLRVWVGAPLPPRSLELRVWVGAPPPPRPSTREAAPPCPPSRVGELRVNCGWGRSRRDSDTAANAPTRFYTDFPPPGLGGDGRRTPGRGR